MKKTHACPQQAAHMHGMVPPSTCLLQLQSSHNTRTSRQWELARNKQSKRKKFIARISQRRDVAYIPKKIYMTSMKRGKALSLSMFANTAKKKKMAARFLSKYTMVRASVVQQIWRFWSVVSSFYSQWDVLLKMFSQSPALCYLHCWTGSSHYPWLVRPNGHTCLRA